MATVYPWVHDHVAHLPRVKGAVLAEAEWGAYRARGKLAMHRKTGQAHVEVEQGVTDCLISLVDPAALSIEFGHGAYATDDGLYVGASTGLRIVTGIWS